MDGGPGEALDDAVELEAAIEAVGEAGEVRLGVLGADVMVGVDSGTKRNGLSKADLDVSAKLAE
jgi:hypothetical protein